jgi:hypothetical protein
MPRAKTPLAVGWTRAGCDRCCHCNHCLCSSVALLLWQQPSTACPEAHTHLLHTQVPSLHCHGLFVLMQCSLLLAACLLAAGYHMLQRVSFETDLAETCRRHNVSLLAYSPLAGEHTLPAPTRPCQSSHRTAADEAKHAPPMSLDAAPALQMHPCC